MSVLIRLDNEEFDKMSKHLKNFEVVRTHTDYHSDPPIVDRVEFQRIPFVFVRKGGPFDVPTDT